MKLEDITVEVRSVALGRLGQIDLAEIDDLKIIKRFRNVGNWTMSLPADYQGATELAQAGRGLVVTGPGNRVLMSGPVSTFMKRETSDDSDGMWYFQGTDDMVHLADGLCFPTPGAAVTAQSNAYDIFASNAEDTLRYYVNVNRGPSAPESRRISGLVLEPASLARGGLVIGRARFDQMGPFLDRLASSGGVGFDVAQVGSQLQFQVYVPSNRSSTVRMDIDNDMLIETEYGFSAPSTTRPVVAGQGEMEARLFFQKTSIDSLAAESAWGRKIETFKDRRDTPDPAELEQEANALLAEGGKTVTSLSVKPADESTMRYAVDWYLGDIVGVIVDGQELTSVVTEAIISIDADGIRISATIGDPTGFDFESKMIARNQDQEKRIQNMEKNNGSINFANLGGVPSVLKTDPNADRILFWDDSAGALTFLSLGAPLSIVGTQLETTLASVAETVAGSATDRAVTPASLAGVMPLAVADLAALPAASAFREGARIHVDALNVDFVGMDSVWVQAGIAIVATTGDRDTEYAKASAAYRVDGAQVLVTASPRITFTYHTSAAGVVIADGWFPTAGALPTFRQSPSSTQSVATSVWTLTSAIWGATETLVEFTSFASGVLTVKHTGFYLIEAIVSFPTGGGANRAIQILTNSIIIDSADAIANTNVNSNRGAPALTTKRLAAGDALRVFAFQTIGSSQSIQTLESETHWSVRYLGPA